MEPKSVAVSGEMTCSVTRLGGNVKRVQAYAEDHHADYLAHSDSMAESESNEIRIFAVIGAALISYLGFGVTLWSLARNHSVRYLMLGIYALVVLLILILVRHQRICRNYATLKEHCINVNETLVVIDEIGREALALVSFLVLKPLVDSRHHLTFVREVYRIEGEDGFFIWTIEGINATNTPSTSFDFKISGDSSAKRSEIPITAVDVLARNETLDISWGKDKPHCKSFAVKFRKPLGGGDRFRIQIKCGWQKAFPRSRSRDYVFSPWGAFSVLGVDHLTSSLECDLRLSEVVLERVEDGERFRESRQPIVYREPSGIWIAEWEVVRPEDVYMLSFTKTISSGRNSSHLKV